MKKQDYVFDLIKSLTRGEKRNFRMLTQLTSGSKKYLKLFDCMDGMDGYDESKILKKFKSDPSFEKQFAYNKNYLYNAILNSLAYFHKGPNSEVSSLTLQVEILMQKNLYDQAKKLLRKVKERVLSHEKFEDLLKLFGFELEILRLTENYKILRESLRQIEFEERLTLEKISNLMKMRHLSAKIEILMTTIGTARREDDLKLIEGILAMPEMEGEERALSNRAKILYHQVMRNIYRFQDNHRDGAPHVNRIIELYESNSYLLEGDRLGYLKMLSVQVLSIFMVSGYEKALTVIEKVMAFKPQTPQECITRFGGIYLYLLGMHSDQGMPASEEFLLDFHTELEKLEDELPPKTKLYAFFTLMMYYHLQGEYSKALKACNDFLNHPHPPMMTSTQSAARIYNLVIHYELGNYDLIEYSLKSTSRFIYKIGRMFRFERRILRFFGKVINAKSKEEELQEFIQLRDDLTEIFQDPYEAVALQTFSALDWVTSKIEGIPFANLVQKTKAEHLKRQQQEKEPNVPASPSPSPKAANSPSEVRNPVE